MPEQNDQTVRTTQDSIQNLAGLPARFESRGLIGQGGMGMVFRAHDTQLGRDVAVKVLLFEGAKDAEQQERFTREAKALAILDHRNIVKLLSFGRTESGNFYHVMELLEGKPLSSELGDGKRLSAERFHTVFTQVLSGLAYAHRQGLVHRDIKPSNIIVSENAGSTNAKIIDFGIVRFDEKSAQETGGRTLTQTSAILGSPGYMSPEQCKGAKVDQTTDIYSLACIMYEALTGAPPHKGETALELMYKRMNEDAPSLEKEAGDAESGKLGNLIDRCLKRNRQDRPQNAESVMEELDEIFKSGLSKSAFFCTREKRERSSKKLFLLVFSGAVCLSALALLFCFGIQKKQADESSANSILVERRATKKGAADLELIRKTKLASNLYKEFVSAGDSEKRDRAKKYFEALCDLAVEKRNRSDYEGSDESLDRAFEFAPVIEGAEHDDYRAIVWLERAKVKLVALDYGSAENLIDRGLLCRSKEARAMPDLAFEKIRLLLRRRELESVPGLIRVIENAAWMPEGNLEEHVTSRNSFAQPQGVESVLKVHEELSAFPITSKAEALKILLLENQLMEFLLEHQLGSTAQQIVDTIEKLVSRPELQDEEAALRQSFANLLNYAKQSGDSALEKRCTEMLSAKN